MIELFLPFAFLIQPIEEEKADFQDGEASAQVDPSTLKRIFVRDSRKAALTDVDHPMQDICVRFIKAGSRVKAQTICQAKASWKAYVAALDAMDQEWDSGQRGLRTEELNRGFGGPGRAIAPGGGPSRPPGG